MPYPGGSPAYNIAIMNVNQREPLTLTSLSSSLHGDLNGMGECALPQTIAPNGTYWCRYSGPVSGLHRRQAAQHRHGHR